MSLSDNRLVLYEPLPRLQDIAAFNVALNLTMSYAKHVVENVVIVYFTWRVPEFTIFPKSLNKIYEAKPDDLIIPCALEAMVKKYVKNCCAEIQQLLDFYANFDSFGIRRIETVHELMSNIVWKSNSKIDYIHTAFNLVNSDRLEEEVKFRVMCDFCMEDKIRTAWFEMRDRSCIETLRFEPEPLLVYWYCVMTGDFSRIVDIGDTSPAEKHVLLNLHDRFAHFPVVEYFFNRLDVDDRIEVGATLMQEWCGWTRFLISKYTEDEQYRLFSTSKYISGIIGAFARNTSYEYHLDDALKIWNHFKNLVNGELYLEILEEMDFWRSHIRDELLAFFKEFWRVTPHHLKKYMFQLEEDEFMPQFRIFPSKDDSFNAHDDFVQRDDRILIAVLSDADLEYRKRFWRRKWVKIVNQSQPSRLKEILNMCILNDEMPAFKKDAMTSPIIRKYLQIIIEKGKFLELHEFLKMFIDGEQREIDDAKRKLFEERTKSDLCSAAVGCEETEESVAGMIEFLRVVFEDDVMGEARFKKQMILGWFEDNKYCIQNKISKIIYVSNRICEAALLKKVRNGILKKYEILLSTRDGYCLFEKSRKWDELLLWCLRDQQEVEEFKTSCKYLGKRNKEQVKRRKTKL